MGLQADLRHHIISMHSQTTRRTLLRRNRTMVDTTRRPTTPGSSLLKAMDTMRRPSSNTHLRRQVTPRISKSHPKAIMVPQQAT